MKKDIETFLWTFAVLLLSGSAIRASNLSVLLNEENTTPSDIEEDASDVIYRLPIDTYPEHYDLQITTNVDKGERSFQGKVVIDIVVVNDTNRIVLHAFELEIINAKISSYPEHDILEKLSLEQHAKRNFLIFTRQSKQLFRADKKYKLTINYRGELRSDMSGFFMTKYIGVDGNDRYMAETIFEPTSARRGFPCYDEPGFRANFTITINHNSNYKAVSNMPVNEKLSRGGKTVFLTTPPIPSYIVVFVVSDFEFTEGIFGGIKNRIYFPAGATNKHDWALVPAMLMAKQLSEYFGFEFILPKLDYFAIPDRIPGGVENYGLVILPETSLLNTITVDTKNKNLVVKLVAHELVHQWFGGYVSVQWWSYLWLKEGFATLFSNKAMDKAFPDWNVWQNFHTEEFQASLYRDVDSSYKPMTFNVNTYSDIRSIYGGSSYIKASCVLHMWNNALTEKVFNRALQNFLTDNQYKPVKEEELFLSFKKAVEELDYKLPAPVRYMMGSWTQQNGYPLLTVTRNYSDGSFTVKQDAFWNHQSFENDKTWYIPINYAAAANPDFRNTEASHYLLNVKEMTIPAQISEDDWLLLNKQSSGYYRINYDERNWQLITKSLVERPSIFHSRNRAQLMDDAHYASMAGRLNHTIVFGLLSYLKQEDQLAPWTTVLPIYNFYSLNLLGHPNYEDFKFFFAQQVGPVYKQFSANKVQGEHPLNEQTRAIIINLACDVGVEECLNETNNKLKEIIYDNKPIEPTLTDSIYSNGARKSSDEFYDYLYQRLMNSTDQNLRKLLFASLSGSENEKQLRKLINSSIDMSNSLTPEERLGLLTPVHQRSEIGLTTCIEFLNDNWIDYGNLSSNTGLSNPLDVEVRSMASRIKNKVQEEKYLIMLAKAKSHQRVSPSLESDVLRQISANFDFIKYQGQQFMNWFSKYRSDAEKDICADS